MTQVTEFADADVTVHGKPWRMTEIRLDLKSPFHPLKPLPVRVTRVPPRAETDGERAMLAVKIK